MKVQLLEYPNEKDWFEVKRRCAVTVGLSPKNAPTDEWKRAILKARHSPIRYLQFSFYLEIPYWVSVHLCRHIHAQPYVRSQRNDRQSEYDRNKAPQDAPVKMIWDINGEELLVIANKRLCKQASKETQEVVRMMCNAVLDKCPEFDGQLEPQCARNGGVCYEIYPCYKS